MNLTDVFNLVENDSELEGYIDKILKKNKKTKVVYLESLNHLSYLLYLDRQEVLAEKLLGIISLIPFDGDYNYWVFIESSIVLLAFIQEKDKSKVIHLKERVLSKLNYGDESKRKINTNVHKRFLSGSSLENRISKVENASNIVSEMELRLLYLKDLLKLSLFIDESTFEEEVIRSRIDQQIAELQKFISDNGIFSLFPFKG
jgi:hypothetical protein